MDYVRDVPYGLVVCHVDGRQAAVTGLGDGGLVLRTAERGHFGAVLVRFLDPKRGEYVPFWTQNGRILAQKRTGLGWETELSLPDPAFTALARRALHAWADFVRDRLAGEYGFPGPLAPERPERIGSEAPGGGRPGNGRQLWRQNGRWP